MQLNKLKLGIKNCTEVTLKISKNVGDSNDENNFPHKFVINWYTSFEALESIFK